MKLSVLSAGAFLLLVCSSPALDKAKYMPVALGMMKFPDQPTEAAFLSIESKMAALSPLDYKSDDDQHVILISAAFLVGAHDRYGWSIDGSSQIGNAALEIISGKGKVAAYLKDDGVVDDSKLDCWWMAYLGSQDEAYLFKLLKYAGDPAHHNASMAVVVQLATWSFKSNCQQIKSVREFARRRLDDPAYKDREAFLRSCLKSD